MNNLVRNPLTKSRFHPIFVTVACHYSFGLLSAFRHIGRERETTTFGQNRRNPYGGILAETKN